MQYEISVVGGGTMGHGLALHVADHGHPVTLVEHRTENLDRARERIGDTTEMLAELDVLETSPEAVLGRIEFTVDANAGLANADVVLETISEDLEAKRDLFARATEAAPADTILATNTSGLQIGDIAAAVPEAADRVAGCHWWNPPYLMPLVEVVRGPETTTETVERVEAFVRSVDRDPIRVDVDVPGIVWNRIQFAVLREAMYLVESGVASIEDVNKAVRDGYARRTAAIGPFETVDLSSLELFRTIADGLYPHLSQTTEPSPLFEEYVDEGRTGVEAGAGFFEYDESLADRTRYRDAQLAALADAVEASRREG